MVDLTLERYERGFMRELIKTALLLLVVYIAWNFIVLGDLNRHNANITEALQYQKARGADFDILAQY